MTKDDALREVLAWLENGNFVYPTRLRESIKKALAHPEHDCTRSHPHEEMSKECELRTEIARLRNQLAQPKPVIEIEFLDWVHPKLGVTPVEVDGGKPLILRAKLKEKK